MRSYITTDVEIDFDDFSDDELIEALEDRKKYVVIEYFDLDDIHRVFESESPESFQKEFRKFLARYSRL